MSSFQNSVNQLIGSFSYYTSIDPGLREKQAERKAIERANINAKKADEAVGIISQDIDDRNKDIADNEDAVYNFVSSLDSYADHFNRSVRLSNAKEGALRMSADAKADKFWQDPSPEHLDDMLAAKTAVKDFQKKAGQQFSQERAFLDFWNELEQDTGKQHELYDVSKKYKEEKGGKK